MQKNVDCTPPFPYIMELIPGYAHRGGIVNSVCKYTMLLHLDTQYLALYLIWKHITSESLNRHSYAQKLWQSIQIWSVSINKLYRY